MTWRTYRIHVDGYDPFTTSAKSASAAKYDAWGRFREPYPDVTFLEFLKRTRATSCPPPEPPLDGYDYVRRNYDLDVRIGDRVELQDEGSSSGKQGRVIYPGPSTAHVHVILDGEAHSSRVHPFSIRKLDAVKAAKEAA